MTGVDPAGARGGAARLNDRTGWAIALLTFLAPIPVASHRPVIWLVWAAILGLALALHQARVAMPEPGTQPGRALRIGQHPWLAAGIGAVLLAVTLQFLPARLAPFEGLPDGVDPARLTLSAPASTLGLIRLLSYAALFVLVLEVASDGQRVRRIGWAIHAGITAHAIWALAALTMFGDRFFWGEKTAYLGMATGTFVNRNSFATFLGMGLCLGLALVLGEARGRRGRRGRRGGSGLDAARLERLILWLSLAVVFYALLRTQSRMGLAAALAGVFVVVLAMRCKAPGRAGTALWQAGGLLAGAGLAIVLLGRQVLERGLLAEVSLESRLALYGQVLELVRQRPLAGHGLDSFAVAFPLVHAPPVSPAVIWNLAHNSYLTLWVELGLVAGTVPMLMLGGAAIGLVRRVRRRNTHFAMPVAALGALCTGALHSLTDFSLEIEANAFLLIVLVGLGLGRLRGTRGAG